jgi:NarL family two-component system response regulator LiaR
MTIIRTLIVDDHPVVRKGMVAMLNTEPDIEIVGECSNGEEAITKSFELIPDVILMDLMMPKVSGIEAIKQILQKLPQIRILVLTSFTSSDKIMASIDAGAKGYMLKDSDPDDLIKAIHQVYRGESSLHPTVARMLLDHISKPAVHEINASETLTEREIDVLKYIAQGLSNQEIAEILVVSKTTVYTHVSNILSKLQLDNRTQAALYAIREGYITFPSKS